MHDTCAVLTRKACKIGFALRHRLASDGFKAVAFDIVVPKGPNLPAKAGLSDRHATGLDLQQRPPVHRQQPIAQ